MAVLRGVGSTAVQSSQPSVVSPSLAPTPAKSNKRAVSGEAPGDTMSIDSGGCFKVGSMVSGRRAACQ